MKYFESRAVQHYRSGHVYDPNQELGDPYSDWNADSIHSSRLTPPTQLQVVTMLANEVDTPQHHI